MVACADFDGQRPGVLAMISALASTALLMGLAGGPHCVAMCGAACAGIGRSAGKAHELRGQLMFQLGRIASYSVMGALASASMQGLGWLTLQSAAIRPVWMMLHVAMVLLGITLLWQARQPVWVESVARGVWRRLRTGTEKLGAGAPLLLGAVWAFMPCGLLYSALLVAALSGGALEGAVVMASFAAGSSLCLLAAPWVLHMIGRHADGGWGVRLAGAALATASGWALWMGLVHDAAPWCITQ